MMAREIITKYSDFAISTINYFIEAIEDTLNYRDLGGLTNRKIDKIKVTKQHPLVAYRMAELNPDRKLDEIRSSLVPAIAVTPGNVELETPTLGQTLRYEAIDDDFINILKVFYNKSDKDIQKEVLISKDQISTILSRYRHEKAGALRAEIHEWQQKEEVNISLWSDFPDLDNLMSIIMDSILTDVRLGLTGDNSKIRNLQFRISKGLTNFNFGRVLFGCEYSISFANTYSNYIIFFDDVISDTVFDLTYRIPGEV